MPMQEDLDRTISKQEAVFPAAPHGSEILITVRLQGGTASEHNYVVHLPPTSIITYAEVIMRMVGYPPPPPPESTQDRRKRLMTEVLNAARNAGRLGLTIDDQTNTVNALMAALSDEFEYDEEMGGEH